MRWRAVEPLGGRFWRLARALEPMARARPASCHERRSIDLNTI